MAPQKNGNQEDLHAPLISCSEESLSEQSNLLLGEQLDVVIVQPEGHAIGGSLDGDAAGMRSSKSDGSGGAMNKGDKKNGAEGPINCPHLETALFFFGIAGMIVSVLMLLQHIIGNLISYY